MRELEWLAAGLSLAALSCYAAAGVLYIKKKKGAGGAALLGWLFNLGIFVKNSVLNGYAPFASMYQVLGVLALCFLPIGLLLIGRRATDRWLWPFFCFPAAVPLVGTLFMDKQLKWALVPALQSAWFVPHVLSYMLSYCLAAVAFVLTAVSVIKGGKSGDLHGENIRYEDAIYRILQISFPFMTIGLCFGALWADQVWGNFWQWDVKEIWSLITALCYLCYFHWRRVPGGKRTARVWSVLGFASLIVTFLCVNLLPGVEESFHLYA